MGRHLALPSGRRWAFPGLVRIFSLVALVLAGVVTALPSVGRAVSAAPIVTDEDTMNQLIAAARQHAPVAGPFGNDAISLSPQGLDDVIAKVQLRDFYTHVSFTNPVAAAQHSWDIGFGFRDTGPNQQYRLIISSDGSWVLLWEPDQQPTASGNVSGLATGAGQTNTLDLVAAGAKAYFALNGTYVATLDVSKHTAPGDVWIASGFYADDSIAGAKTPYADFAVWSLAAGENAASPAASPVASPAATGDADVLNRWEAAARRQQPAAGPASGAIQQSADTLNFTVAHVNLSDFYAHVRFTNPVAASQHAWDYGFGFRDVGKDQEYRLIVISDGSWVLVWSSDQQPLATGKLSGLATGAGQTNTLDLVAAGTKAYFALNGAYVATLDVSQHTAPGDVWVSSAFYDKDTVAGQKTAFSEFTVWPLTATGAGSPAATAGAPLLGPTPAPTSTEAPVLLGPTPTPKPKPGVSGNTYTSPTYGFTLTWSREWSVVSEASQGGTDLLRLTNGTSAVSFQTATNFGGDIAACRSALVNQLSSDPKKSGVTQGTDASGKPLQGGGADRTWAVYLYTQQGANGQTTAMARYLECWVLAPNRAVLAMIDDVPVAKFNTESPKLQALLKTLVIAPPAALQVPGAGARATAGTGGGPGAPAPSRATAGTDSAPPAPPTPRATAASGG